MALIWVLYRSVVTIGSLLENIAVIIRNSLPGRNKNNSHVQKMVNATGAYLI